MTPFRIQTATTDADIQNLDDWSRYVNLIATFASEPARSPSVVATMLLNRARRIPGDAVAFSSEATEPTETLRQWAHRSDINLEIR